MSSPTPRPALRRAPDAYVSPAAPVVDSEPVELAESLIEGKNPKSSSGKKGKKGKKRRSELTVRLPKGLREQFDSRVKEEGYQADDVVAMLIQAWLNR